MSRRTLLEASAGAGLAAAVGWGPAGLRSEDAKAADSLTKGKVELKSAGPLAFGPNGILFVGDPQAALIYAIDTGDNTAPATRKQPKIEGIDAKVANSSSLRDVRGNRRPLHDFKDNKAIVLVFLGAECPVSNLYLPELIELEKKYRDKSVQFLAVYPNQPEDLDAVAAHAHDRDLPFPALKDFGQKLADRLGVTRVPAVAVLDGAFALRYRGGVDTQLNALDADRDLFQAQLQLAQIRLDELLSVVQLYKALGGGWQV